MSHLAGSQTVSQSSESRKKSVSEGSEPKTETRTSSTTKKSKTCKKENEMSAFERQWEGWKKYIKKHRQDIRNAKPVVDDNPPKLNIAVLYDQEMLRGEQKAITSVFALNPEVVKRLHHINVFGGKTDTFQYDYSSHVPSSNFSTRRCAALQTENVNKLLKKRIENTVPRVPRVQEYAEFWKSMEAMMEYNSDFPLFWKVKKKKKIETIEVGPSKLYFKQYITEKSAKYSDGRPRVFFEISVKNGGTIGKMVAVLFSDYVPMTVKNFLTFCNPKGTLTYKGCFFYLIFPNFFCQTGDIVENKGFGGTSIYGPYFGDEDHTLQHGERGVLTMFNKIPNRNQCQFLITFRELKTLNGSNVVFGKIIRGFHVLEAIESVGSRMTGRPKVDIYISDCDEI